ncbi:MAG TPA: rhodanese-like domain-containing protein [Candidatus Paceibacterota bacterium]|nr:rhodanese-like domain-containing protein [Candidatus Paceibacterota bacterium]
MILIDVRTKEEYGRDHIEGAILHDIMDMMQGKFPEIEKSEEIKLYCESGNRSMMAKSLMEKAGFTNVTNAGGIDDLR